MAKRYRVHYRRADRCYTIVTEAGKEVARCDELDEAWRYAEQLEADAAARVTARQATAERLRPHDLARGLR